MLTSKRKIIIVANGRLWEGIVREIRPGDVVIGVDRGAYWLLERGVRVDLAIGDFDSMTKNEFASISSHAKEVRQFPPEKDFTDTELALNASLTLNPKEIIIYAAIGSRIDHTLASLSLLERCQRRGIHAEIRDERNRVEVVGRGRTILKGRAGLRYVSVIPITNSIVISLSKLKYEITKKRILRGQTIGISNEFLGPKAEIEVHRGKALVVQSRD